MARPETCPEGREHSLVGRDILTINTAAPLAVETSSEAITVQLEALDLAAVATDTPAIRNVQLRCQPESECVVLEAWPPCSSLSHAWNWKAFSSRSYQSSVYDTAACDLGLAGARQIKF